MPSPAPRPLAVVSLLGLLLGAVAIAATIGCRRPAPATPPPAAAGIKVIVSIPPLVGLIEPLLTEGGSVQALIPPGRSEHGFEFKPAEFAALARADVVVYVGSGLEPQIETFLATRPDPRRRVVCFAAAAAEGPIAPVAPEAEQHDGADHAGHDEHRHPGPDPHLWLDPHLCQMLVTEANAAIQAAYRDQKLLSPEARRRSDQALTDQIGRLRGLDDGARTTLAPFKGQALVTHHDAWRRLAERYGLSIAAVIRPIETGEPTPGAITAAVDAIRARHVRAIFVEPQFNRAAADRIAKAAGVRVATLDPLGDGDYFKMMRANIDAIAAALDPGPSRP